MNEDIIKKAKNKRKNFIDDLKRNIPFNNSTFEYNAKAKQKDAQALRDDWKRLNGDFPIR